MCNLRRILQTKGKSVMAQSSCNVHPLAANVTQSRLLSFAVDGRELWDQLVYIASSPSAHLHTHTPQGKQEHLYYHALPAHTQHRFLYTSIYMNQVPPSVSK